jgi:hypothetical protein
MAGRVRKFSLKTSSSGIYTAARLVFRAAACVVRANKKVPFTSGLVGKYQRPVMRVAVALT